MEYCFVAGNYPTKERQVHVFLENVVVRLVDRGETCNVVAPQSLVAYFFKPKAKRKIVSERTTANGNKYMVYSPLYFVLPKIKIGKYPLSNLSRYMIYRALKKTYRKNKFNADVIYSHFIDAGIPGVRLAKELGIASVIANGEADAMFSLRIYTPELVQETLDNVTGIISVSTKNRNEVHQICGGREDIMSKVKIIVNAVDGSRFHKIDRAEARRKLGWPEDKFIVAFTGTFIERKGVLRLSNALDRFDDVYSVFMGVGPNTPKCKNILHCGRVNNADMNTYLNAADIFVLPTLAEGCSNAIVEAVCCGLPVVSADMEFNYDILDDSCAILIDPNSEDEIYEAIKKLKQDKAFRDSLEQGALNKADRLSLDVRVDRIQDFIGGLVN